MSEIVLRVAAKAVIVNDKRQVLLVREAADHDTNTKAGLYQVVGGRLEPGENFDEGLKRESMEETGLRVSPVNPVSVGEWHPVINGVKHQIIAIFMLCKVDGPLDVSLSGEHDSYEWVDKKNFENIQIMEPDRTIISKVLNE